VVRNVSANYDNCIKPNGHSSRIDLQLAREQHLAYCLTLQQLGLTLLNVNAVDSLPDCCFVEDTAIVAGATAIITHMKAPTRAQETTEVKKLLENYKTAKEILPPGLIDGGDVLKINNNIYIGISERTNLHAVEQVKALVVGQGYEVIPVELKGTLHLKTACTYLGDGWVIMAPGHFDQNIFAGYQKIVVPVDEAYSANCLAVNGKILVPSGYPRTRERIEKEGFATVEVDISEFRKGNGGLTCLSIIF
ncbi:MAG TPA: arginine deiminase family protein, partial [Desulfobacteria bacterium]|nr:arginine deiminase family protein [Desulfobacteria bacterium]